MAKVDTVGDNYYKPLRLAERLGEVLFWLVSLLSVTTLFVDKAVYPLAASTVQIALITLVVLFFIQGLVQRLYLFPRAEDKRRQELLSNSFGVSLTHEETVGYYNNEQTQPINRLAASVMESAFFTHKISGRMLIWERVRIISYLVIYLVAALIRSTELELLAIAAQALFGGEIIARWVRTEWINVRTERAFENFNRLFNAGRTFGGAAAQSEALDLFAFYETTKATAGVLMSTKVYDKHNPRLTREWEQIRSRLGV